MRTSIALVLLVVAVILGIVLAPLGAWYLSHEPLIFLWLFGIFAVREADRQMTALREQLATFQEHVLCKLNEIAASAHDRDYQASRVITAIHDDTQRSRAILDEQWDATLSAPPVNR